MSGLPAGAGSLLGKRLGKYEILALLALGGTAEIYLARIGGHAGFEKYVVVKCLHDHLADDAEFVKMFLDEARLAAHLDHSNIVQTMELGEHENRYYMVMEFLAGLSLAMMVRRAGERLPGGRLPVPLVLNMIAQSCAGLHYAHERVVNGKPLNIVHRDISPQNLVVSFEGVVKVVDFGIAKAELRETRTQSGTIKGKFAYMSPEQCVATNVDRRTDVFALGVIAHELLTGRRLFKKPSPYETYQAVIECAVEPPSRIDPTLDPALDALVMRAVAKDREQRYATAEELGDALSGYMHQRGIRSGPGDVGRFFESSFGQDIEEHGARMRELIAGRVADPGAGWGSSEEEGGAGAAGASGSIDPDLPASSSLSGVIGELAAAGRASTTVGEEGGGEDEGPAERTRIETNPLERINELDAEHARSHQMQAEKTPAPVPKPAAPPPVQQQAQAGPPSAQPPRPSAQTPRPMPAIPSGPLATSPGTTLPEPRAPGATPAPLLRPASGKFPQAANLPTMIAQPNQGGGGNADDDDDDDDDGNMPELAQTELGAPVYSTNSDPNAMTVLEMAAPDLDQVRASMGLPPQPAGGPSPGSPGSQPPGPAGASMGAGPPMPPRPQLQNMPIGPAGYPVMSAEMRDHIASGASVFPSASEPHRPHDLQRPNERSNERPNERPNEPHRPMDLGHPMGQHPMGQHPMTSDWPVGPTAGGAPKRPMPPWMLAVLFIGVVGGALLITILIAQAMR